MKVILKEEIKEFGNKFAIVEVKDGFARNYLLPRGLAVIASQANIAKINEEKQKQILSKNLEKKKLEDIAGKLSGLACNVKVEATDKDIIYGSVCAEDIVMAIKEEGHIIDKVKVILDEPIKKLGIYEVTIELHPEVRTKIKVWVVRK